MKGDFQEVLSSPTDAYEEALDLSVYLRRCLDELDKEMK